LERHVGGRLGSAVGMTEIPEHLLARSKARRSAIGQSEGGGEADAPAATPSTAVERAETAAAPAGPAAPATTSPAKAPVAAAPPPAAPKRPEVVAAESRKKIPYWAVPALIALPGWAFLYAYTMDPRIEDSPAIAAGREVYQAKCSSCHGATGGGGQGPALSDGDVALTFPDFADHVNWVTLGAASANPDGTYGDPAREGGQHNTSTFTAGMPAFGTGLSEDQILEVVRFEREVISAYGCEPALAELTDEECVPGTEAETASP
jgi:mono/diheme cytochrome c family protein